MRISFRYRAKKNAAAPRRKMVDKTDGTLLRPWLVPQFRPTDLARQAGCTHQYVYAVLNGQKPASARLIDAADALGFPIAEIYGDRT